MLDDVIDTIEQLIKSQQGDVERLKKILMSIRNGESLPFEDHQYVESLSQANIKQVEFTSNTESKTSESEMQGIPSLPDITSTRKMPMKKILIIGIIIVISLTAYAVLDAYAVNSLQFRPHRGQQNVISETQLQIKSDACNPSYFPVSFHSYEIKAYYGNDEIEKAVISGSTLSPKSGAVLDGVFSINKEAVTRIGQQNSTFDATKAVISTKVSAPIFGFIPYAVDKKYPAQEFQKLIRNPPPGSFDCA